MEKLELHSLLRYDFSPLERLDDLLATSGENFMSTGLLEIYLLRTLVTCSLFILAPVTSLQTYLVTLKELHNLVTQ